MACSAADPSATHDDGASVAGQASALQAGGKRYRAVHRVSAAPSLRTQAATNAHLTYRGGPVLPNVQVVTVFWNNKVQFQKELDTFYGEITSSAYYDWLTEYNTSTQTIGHGKLLASHVDTGAPTQTALTDADVQNEVGRLIDEKKVPAPNENTLYMVHFPPGVSIDDSCVTFCAYHGSFDHNGARVAYGVMPDQGGSCDGGCGTATQMVDNTTQVSSHELIEATTDPAVGESNLAWYDDSNGEIGDICVGGLGTVKTASGTKTVQTEWSNKHNKCMTTATE
jgi:hypothetical protein